MNKRIEPNHEYLLNTGAKLNMEVVNTHSYLYHRIVHTKFYHKYTVFLFLIELHTGLDSIGHKQRHLKEKRYSVHQLNYICFDLCYFVIFMKVNHCVLSLLKQRNA